MFLFDMFQVHLGVCIGCSEKFETKSALVDHMHERGHTNQVPDMVIWDQPQLVYQVLFGL